MPLPGAIVVGAGPAGATAALTLARAGVTVRLLDRSNFPRQKPCGGAVSIRALQRFPYLETELSRIGTHRVSRLHLEGPDGDATVIESGGPAVLLIRRIEFDARLVSLAVDAGAELVGGVDIVQAREHADSVTLVARDGRSFSSPIVVAADGVHSVVARRLGLRGAWAPRSVALDMMEETPQSTLRAIDPSVLWAAYGYDWTRSGSLAKTNPESLPAPEGYAYVFPKCGHVNVGIGYVLDHFRMAIDRAPYDLQRTLVSDLVDRGVLGGDSSRACFTPFLIPVGGPARQIGRGRVLLAGDAGGFVNGVTAEGIYYAMVSGELAARAILASPRDLTALAARYAQACRAEIGAELQDSVLLQRFLFRSRHRIGRIIGAARQSPVTPMILGWAMGQVPYGRIRRRIMAGTPGLVARMAWARLKRLWPEAAA